MKRKKKTAEAVKIGGFFRVNLVEGGKIVGDSGWCENTITGYGYYDYIIQNLIGAAGSKRITHMAIGTGTAPGTGASTLEGEVASRVTVSTSTLGASSNTLQCTAQFASSVFSTQTVRTIQNIGLVNSSNAGTLFSGSTYGTSQWNTNQDLNATYQVRFS